MKNRLLHMFVCGSVVLLGLAACDDDNPAQVPCTLTLDRSQLTLAIGQTHRLTATLDPQIEGAELVWSSDNATVAIVTDGLVEARAEGTATVTVRWADATPASCRITVSKDVVPVTDIALDRTTLDMEVGETHTLTATVTPDDATDKTVVWNSSDPAVVTVEEGLVTALNEGTSTITATAGDCSATCVVNVGADDIEVMGIAIEPDNLDIGLGGTATLTVLFTPENATDKTITWSSSAPESVSVEEGVVMARDKGTSTITATTTNGCTAICTVSVMIPPEEPKIGDYYYADGTWSDGGLESIDPDGLNPVWAEPKPAPESGKTVVGIVFQTNPERIAESDKANGYTHGYAVAVRNAHGGSKPTTSWSFDYEFDCLKNAKTSDVWYWNVNGYYETMTVRDTYGASITQCPAFDWTLNDFPLTAPEGTSGWFLPSTGQLWDMIANLCGHEVAAVMKDWSTQELNASYGYATETVSYDTMERFNRSLAQIPTSDKEELFVTSSEYYSTCSLWASTPSTAGETACIINVGTKGTIELYEEYIDGDCIARPILAF